MIILAIETSCDETAIAVVESKNNHHKILANIVSSQVKIHAKYGGVVPNLASRYHLKNIVPCLKLAFKKAKISSKKIDHIAITIGPGLIPALLIGTNTAKALSFAYGLPIIGINHIEAHIYANWIQPISVNSKLFPVLCLVVSGGHTQLILMKGHGKYKLLGETRDDAAGEAFDKVAKLLGLGYPGGPIIEKRAKRGNPEIFNFPRPMKNSKDYDFSFSGLKTAVLYLTRQLKPQKLKLPKTINNLCVSFQQAAVDVLIAKTIRAAKEYKTKTVILAGGVAANLELRNQFRKNIKKQLPSIQYLTPNIQYCTDNAVMVAVCAYYRLLHKKSQSPVAYGVGQSWRDIRADANLRIA